MLDILPRDVWPVWLGKAESYTAEIKAILRPFEDGGSWTMTEQAPARAAKAKSRIFNRCCSDFRSKQKYDGICNPNALVRGCVQRYNSSVHIVYGMIDPRTDAIFYIGQSSDFPARKSAHLEGSDQLSGYAVKQMKLNGFVPLFVVLERAKTKGEALSAEIFWIEIMKARGAALLNAQGVGGYVERGKVRKAMAEKLEMMEQSKVASKAMQRATLEDVANGRSVRTFEEWSALEIRRLKGMAKANMSVSAMADALERAPEAIRRKCQELGLSRIGD